MRIHATALTLSLALPVPLGATETYWCTVEDFIGFDRADTVFIQRNKQKTFRLNIGSGLVTVDMHSDHFTDATATYHITDTRPSSVSAVQRDAARQGTIVFPRNPQARLERNGYFDAVISVTGTFFSNNWKLRCE